MSITPPMSYASTWQTPSDGNEIDFKYEDLAIGGKMITAAVTVTEAEIANGGEGFKSHVRERMVKALVSGIIEQGMIEFTQIKDPLQFNIKVMARCYLAPNDQVKLLRVNVTSKANK